MEIKQVDDKWCVYGADGAKLAEFDTEEAAKADLKRRQDEDVEYAGRDKMASMVSKVRASGDKSEQDVEVLFDTGATLSFVLRAVAEKIATITKLPRPYTILIGDGSKLTITDMAVLSIKAAGETIMDTFLVLDKTLHDVILGEATMRKFGLKIDLEHGTIFSLMKAGPEEKSMKEFLHKLLLALSIEADDEITEDAAIALIKAKTVQPDPPKRPKVAIPKSILDEVGLGEDATEQEVSGAIMALKNPGDTIPAEHYHQLHQGLREREIADLVAVACRAGTGDMEAKLYPHEREWALGEAKKDFDKIKSFIRNRPHVLAFMSKLPGQKADTVVIDDLQAAINAQLKVSPELFKKYNTAAH